MVIYQVTIHNIQYYKSFSFKWYPINVCNFSKFVVLKIRLAFLILCYHPKKIRLYQEITAEHYLKENLNGVITPFPFLDKFC